MTLLFSPALLRLSAAQRADRTNTPHLALVGTSCGMEEVFGALADAP